MEDSYERLKRQEQEWKIKAQHSKEEADEKAEVVEALKKKIAELVVKLQEERREKLQEQERYNLIKGDFEELSRNLEWHKKQLHECQVARDRAQKNLDEEKQRSPKFPGKPPIDENLRENEGSLPVKESSDLSLCIKHTADVLLTKPVTLDDSQRWAKEEEAHWQAMVLELERQVGSWKREAEFNSAAVTKGEKERATWLGRIAELQQRLEECTADLEGFRGKLKDSECRFAEEEERRRVAERGREELRAALQGALKEKATLDGAVECIRDDFERVRKSFELMKSLLTQKEKELANMKAISCKKEAEIVGLDQLGGKGFKALDSDIQKSVASQDLHGNLVGSGKSLAIQCSMNLNDEKKERSVEIFTGPSNVPVSSASLGASPCCLTSMERVDLEWRQKHRTIVQALIKKLKQKKLTESINLQKDVRNPIKGSRLLFSKSIPPFEMLPKPSKFNDSVIMQLISKGQEVIERSNSCSMSTLKSSLMSLEEEVTNLENKIRITFLSEQKQRESKTAGIINSLKQ